MAAHRFSALEHWAAVMTGSHVQTAPGPAGEPSDKVAGSLANKPAYLAALITPMILDNLRERVEEALTQQYEFLARDARDLSRLAKFMNGAMDDLQTSSWPDVVRGIPADVAPHEDAWENVETLFRPASYAVIANVPPADWTLAMIETGVRALGIILPTFDEALACYCGSLVRSVARVETLLAIRTAIRDRAPPTARDPAIIKWYENLKGVWEPECSVDATLKALAAKQGDGGLPVALLRAHDSHRPEGDDDIPIAHGPGKCDKHGPLLSHDRCLAWFFEVEQRVVKATLAAIPSRREHEFVRHWIKDVLPAAAEKGRHVIITGRV